MHEESPKRLWQFDHVEAIAHLSNADKRLAKLIGKAKDFHLNIDEAESPYEALLEAIAYQSISGLAARTIFARVKAFGTEGRAPTPEQLLKVPEQRLRE